MNTRTLIITFVWMIMSNIGIFAQEHWDAQERIELNKGVFPKNFSKAIDIIQYDLLGIERGKSHVKVIDNNTLYINLSFSHKINTKDETESIFISTVRPDCSDGLWRYAEEINRICQSFLGYGYFVGA